MGAVLAQGERDRRAIDARLDARARRGRLHAESRELGRAARAAAESPHLARRRALAAPAR